MLNHPTGNNQDKKPPTLWQKLFDPVPEEAEKTSNEKDAERKERKEIAERHSKKHPRWDSGFEKVRKFLFAKPRLGGINVLSITVLQALMLTVGSVFFVSGSVIESGEQKHHRTEKSEQQKALREAFSEVRDVLQGSPKELRTRAEIGNSFVKLGAALQREGSREATQGEIANEKLILTEALQQLNVGQGDLKEETLHEEMNAHLGESARGEPNSHEEIILPLDKWEKVFQEGAVDIEIRREVGVAFSKLGHSLKGGTLSSVDVALDARMTNAFQEDREEGTPEEREKLPIELAEALYKRSQEKNPARTISEAFSQLATSFNEDTKQEEIPSRSVLTRGITQRDTQGGVMPQRMAARQSVSAALAGLAKSLKEMADAKDAEGDGPRHEFGEAIVKLKAALEAGGDEGELWRQMGEFCFKLADALIIAGLVSILFDVIYHKELIVEPIREIKEQTEGVTKNLQSLLNTLGYDEFRKVTLRAYGKAEQRIVSVSDYWTIDPDWWDKSLRATKEKRDGLRWHSELWEKLTQALIREDFNCEKYVKEGFPLDIYFAGDVPTLGSDGKFTALGFRRFLGIAWRIVMAHNVRNAWRKKFETEYDDPKHQAMRERLEREYGFTKAHIKDIYVPIRVVLTSIPVSVTVVDDQSFMLYGHTKGDHKEELDVYDLFGSALFPRLGEDDVKEEYKARARRTADAHVALFQRYSSQTESARQDVMATLFAAYLLDSSIPEGEVLKDDHTDPQATNEILNRVLEILGVENWIREDTNIRGRIRESLNADGSPGIGGSPIASERNDIDKHMRELALEIVRGFVKCIKPDKEIRKFADLRDELT